MHRAAQAQDSSALGRRATFAGLAVVTLLGLALRVFGLTSYGVWFDEAYHVALVKLPTVWDMLGAVLSNPPSDPLYVLLLRGWTAIWGTGDAAVRSLSVVFSTATIPAAFWLGRWLTGYAAGLLGAGLLAVSPYAIEFGQEAALYALASLSATVALAAAFRWHRTGGGMALYVVCAVAAIYSHYVVAVVLVLLCVALLPLFARAGHGVRWTTANGLVLLAWLPWLVALVVHWAGAAVPRATLANRAGLDDVLAALVQFTSGTSSLQQGRSTLWLIGLAGCALLLAGALLPGAAQKASGVGQVLGVAAVIFLAPAIASSITGLWLFIPHFMLFLLPALLVCAATGMVALSVRGLPWRLLGVAGLGLLTAASLWGALLFYRYPPHGNDGLRDLAALLESEVTNHDVVLVMPSALEPSLQQYYDGVLHGLPEEFDLRRIYLPYGQAEWTERCVARAREIVSGAPGARIWLVYRSELDRDGVLLSALEAGGSRKGRWAYGFAELYLFSPRGAP